MPKGKAPGDTWQKPKGAKRTGPQLGSLRAISGFGTQRVCCFCPELMHGGQTFPVCSRHLAGQPSRELQGARAWTSRMWTFSGTQGWEPTWMYTKVLEQQPWRSLRQQAEVSALFRECQKERLQEILGRSRKGQRGPDLNRQRNNWGACVQFQSHDPDLIIKILPSTRTVDFYYGPGFPTSFSEKRHFVDSLLSKCQNKDGDAAEPAASA
eukprot:XP_027325551.1 uncharacterized protein LOC106019222 isoform X2 [Anas platyrhynchos]